MPLTLPRLYSVTTNTGGSSPRLDVGTASLICGRCRSTIISYIVGFLCGLGKSAGSIRSVLAGLAWRHKIRNAPDFSKSFQISRALIGIDKRPLASSPKLPIRFDLLKRIISVVPKVAKSAYDTALLRAVFALAYYGCCRIGELVDSGSLQHTLKLSNVVQNLERDPPVTTFRLSTAKHARSAAKFRLSGFSDPRYCAVSLLSLYLNLRPLGGGVLFCIFHWGPCQKGLHCPCPCGLPPPGG